MPTVRITGNKPKNIHKTEWIGAPEIDKQGHLARSIDIPEEAFLKIEKAIAAGAIEGAVSLDSGLKYDWLLDGR